jgi:tRNA G18 (ribose-2'-O)-methylase SpoU
LVLRTRIGRPAELTALAQLVPIQSLDDPRVAAYRRIADQQWLVDNALFVAEGRLVVRRLLDLRQWPIESILLTPAAAGNVMDVLDRTDAPVYLVEQALMNDIAGFNIHRGCLALGRRSATATLDRTTAGPLGRVLVLEGVNNPDNVGGLFRSAAAFGVELVVLGPDCGDPLYRKAIRTSMAASLIVPFVQAPQWPGAIRDLRVDGFTVIALTPDRAVAPIEEIFPHSKLALLVGAEGGGLTEEAMRAATLRIRIPTTADVDSLNVTTAASIAMYHCFAERRS